MSLDNDEVIRFRAAKKAADAYGKLTGFDPKEDVQRVMVDLWLDGYEAGKRDEYVRINTRESKE